MSLPPKTGNHAPWFKQKIFWMLMAGPIIVVFAALATWQIAVNNHNDLVSDDYYKDGKHINLIIDRDIEAAKRHIEAQILVNEEGSAAKVFIDGNFNHQSDIHLILLHPAKQAFDQNIKLHWLGESGTKAEYSAVFKTLPAAVHWYVRLEHNHDKWRVENKWLPKQGGTIILKPKQNALTNTATPTSSAS